MITHRIPHSLTNSGARALIEHAFKEYQTELAQARPSLEWLGKDAAQIGGTFGGWTLVGRVELEEGVVEISLTLPGDGSISEAKARRRLDEEAARWLVISRGLGVGT